MNVVQSNRPQSLARQALIYAGAAVTKAAIDRAAAYVRGGPATEVPRKARQYIIQAKNGGGAPPANNGRGGRARRAGRQRGGQRQMLSVLPGQMRNSVVTVFLNNTFSIVNTALNQYAWFATVGFNAGTSDLKGPLGGKFENFTDMYQYFRIVRLDYEFLPRVGYTSTGYIAIGVDPNPRASAPTTITDVARHDYNVTGDIKQFHHLSITGDALHQSIGNGSNWLTTNSNADPEWRAGGALQVFSENGEASGATIGTVRASAILEFKALTAA